MDLNAIADKAKPVIIALICVSVGFQLVRFLVLEYRIQRNSKAPVFTAHATAYYKHPEIDAPYLGPGYRYVYYITFHTDIGESVKLYMTGDDFYVINEGDTGQLTWQGEKFWKFVPDSKEE